VTDSQLQRELRQTRPFLSPAHEATLALLRTADLLTRALARTIEPHGITAQQYNVLRILRGAAPDPLPTLEIGERMIEQTPGITRLLDRLEAKGLVARNRCTSDRRQVHCHITDAGMALLAVLDAPVEALGEELMRPLGRTAQKELTALVDRIRSAAAGDTAGGVSPQGRSPR
jgi:DNA-binding MarR family transcriptional regulator